MRANPLIEKLARDEPVFGPMIMDLCGPGLPQIVANAGADLIVYDMEAGCLDMGTVRTQLALCRGIGLAPLVNVASHEYAMLSRALDSGAMGLMIPVVQSEAEARALVRVTRYPPRGGRGVAFGIAHDDFSSGDIDTRMRLADARTLIMPKIESEAGIAAIDEILEIDGVDVAFLGHMDLSVSLGVPGRYDHPRFVAAVERVIAACRARGKHGACLVSDPDTARLWLKRGFRIVLYATDVMLLGGALKSGLAAIRG